MKPALELVWGTNYYTMAEDLMSRFYTSLNLNLESKIFELTKIIDHSSPNKDLQALFPQLINNIFAPSFGNGWNLKTIANRHDFEVLVSFLEPMGPMFRLCYKLLSDPQLKYDLPLNALPLDLQISLERGRCSQFYADMLIMDSQTMNVIGLALNPFDYYMINFALHLINNNQQQSTWEHWNSAYFALACDYLTHFLPTDPNEVVLPLIPHYTGKVAMAAPLQTANRPLHMPSLLLIPDMCGMSSQHGSPQTQSRNEVWRSETVLQVFIDIWMSVELCVTRDVELYQKNYASINSTPERVRTVRVLVKHIHAFSAKHLPESTVRSSTLPKYARQIMCSRAYHYIKHLVTTWPLDASFRLVMELWLSLIQPWRYTNNNIGQYRRFTGYNNNNKDEVSTSTLDGKFTQFIAENFPSYTCIFQLILPRFMRMDLTAYKNAVMLFRLGKVFAQPHLVPILWNLEQAIIDNSGGLHQSPDASFNTSTHDQSYMYNGVPLHKWVAVAKQSISELNLTTNYEYDPIWSENKTPYALEFVKKIHSSKIRAEQIVLGNNRRLNQKNKGVWGSISHFFMEAFSNTPEDDVLIEEARKVPTYLNNSIHYFANIFMISESSLLPPDPIIGESGLENSTLNSTNFPFMITQKLRQKPTTVQYMGDPDLMPITSYESTILVRILHQVASKLNEMYGEQFSNLWNRNNIWGHVAREILQPPCTIRSYVKDATSHQNVVCQDLPPRLSLRRLGSHSFVIWFAVGYSFFKVFSYSGTFYMFLIVTIWMAIVFIKSTIKMLKA